MSNSAVVGILRALLTANTAEFTSAMKAASDSAKTFSRDFKSVGQQATQIGSALTKTLTLPIVGIGGTVAKLAVDFESSFAGVRKTVEATESQFAEMAQGFRNLAKTIPINVNELNRLGEAAGALGIPRDQVVDFSRVMAELGVTTNVTADQAAESIAKIQNIFGAAGQHTESFASALVALGNNGASTESQILEMATRIAGAGNAIGLTQDQVLGFANALSSVGLEAEAGGSAISRVFIDIASAVSQGGSALQGFAAVAGESAASYAETFRTDAAAATAAFIEGLGRIKQSGGDLLGTLDALGFSEIRVRDTLLRAAGAGDTLTKSLQLSAQAWRENTALTDEARKRFGTTASQLTLLWNSVKDVGITIGNALLPGLRSLVELSNEALPVVERMADAFAGLPGPVQATGIAIGALAALAGPALFIFGQIANAAGLLAGAFTKSGIATKALVAIFGEGSVVIRTLGAAFEILTGPVGWVIGIGAAILTATGTWGDFFRILKAGAEIIGAVVVKAFDLFVWIGGKVIEVLGSIAGFIDDIFGISSGLSAMGHAFQAAMGWMADASERLARKLKTIPPEADAAREALERLRNAGLQPMPSHGGPLVDVGPVQTLAMMNRTLADQTKAAQAEIDGLSTAVRQDLVTAIAGGVLKTKEMADAAHISERAVELLKQQLQASAVEAKASAKAFDDYSERLEDFGAAAASSASGIGVTVAAGLLDLQRFKDSLHGGFDPRIALVHGWSEVSAAVLKGTEAMGVFGDSSRLATTQLGSFDVGLIRAGDSAVMLERRTESLRKQLSSVVKGFPTLMVQSLTGGGGVVGALQGFGSQIGAIITGGEGGWADSIKKKWGGMLGKVLGGIVGPLGALMGPLVGKIVGFFHKTEAQKLMHDVGRDWGMQISDGLAKQMEADSKKYGRQVAELLHLKEIFAEQGGITTSNVGSATAHLRDVFALIGQGQMTIAQGAKVIDDNWQDLVAAGTDAFGFISDQLREIIQLDAQYGTQSKEIAAFLKAQADIAVKGSNAAIAGISKQIQSWVTLKGKIDEATKSTSKTTEEGERLNVLLDEQRTLAAANRGELEDLGTIALSTFSAAVAAGSSFAEALEAAQPGLQQLRQAFDALGISTGNAALQALLYQSAILERNPALLQAVGGLGQSFVALSNMGLLNVDTFRAMERTGVEAYTRLQGEVAAVGGTTKDALLPMQDYLHQAQKAAEDLGVPLDATTQMLIDQSKELGIWQDTGADSTDTLVGGMQDLVSAVKALINTLLGIPDVDFYVTQHNRVVTDPSVPGNNGGSGGVDGDPVTPMKSGGYGRVFSARRFIAGEAGAEDVAFGGAGRSLAVDVAQALTSLIPGMSAGLTAGGRVWSQGGPRTLLLSEAFA